VDFTIGFIGAGAELVALDQSIEPGSPALGFNDMIQLLLKIYCHINPPDLQKATGLFHRAFLTKQRVFLPFSEDFARFWEG
jgi:hypothetical protein